MTVACIYRPPGVVSRQFCDELADLLDQLVTAKHQFLTVATSTDRAPTATSLMPVSLTSYSSTTMLCSTSSMPRVATTHST